MAEKLPDKEGLLYSLTAVMSSLPCRRPFPCLETNICSGFDLHV